MGSVERIYDERRELSREESEALWATHEIRVPPQWKPGTLNRPLYAGDRIPTNVDGQSVRVVLDEASAVRINRAQIQAV